jgi:DNA-binding CsgD family transcriptional regulator
MSPLDRIERICARDIDERALREELLVEIRARVPCGAYVWLLTDPDTCVGAAPLAETPSLADLPTLIRLKYLTSTNRWTSLSPTDPSTLVEATGGDRSRSRVWTELLSGYGTEDILSTVFRDAHGCWGFLDLWRSDATFTADECQLLGQIAGIVTPALRRSLALTFAMGATDRDQGGESAVLLLSADLRLQTQTSQTDAYLRALLPTAADRAPIPAAAYNVAAQLLAQEEGVDLHPPWARVHLGTGRWVTLRAARLPASLRDGETFIAVSIEPTPPEERTALYGRVVGLTKRETELLGHLVRGCDTRELARRLYLSEHTVQDHLKAIFAKTGASNRRVLVARATGTG